RRTRSSITAKSGCNDGARSPHAWVAAIRARTRSAQPSLIRNQAMNREKTNGESTPPANTSFSPASQQRIVGAEMIPADGLAVDDRSKRTTEVAHTITSVALFDSEVIAR